MVTTMDKQTAPKTLEDLKEQISRGRNALEAIHREYLDDQDFYAGNQWGGKENERRREGRSSFVYNVQPAFVHSVTNVARQAPPGIRIDAISDATEEMAKQRQGLVRAIEYECNAQAAYLYALECAAKGGIGWVRVNVVEDIYGEKRVEILNIIDPTAVLVEPNQRPDLTDVHWVAIVQTYTGTQYRREFPNGTAPAGDSAHVRVTELWEIREGRMYQCIFDDYGILHEETQWPGTILPFAACTGEFRLISGEWHYAGIVRDARTPQMEINYLKSEAISQMANAPKAGFIMDADADAGYEKQWAEANRVPRNLRKKRGSEVIPVQPAQAPAGHMQLADQSYAMTSQITGIKPSFGAELDLVSGKSVRYQQGQASVSNYHLLDSLANMVRRVGEIVNELVPFYYNDDRIRMILGEDQSATPVSFGPSMLPDVANHDLGRGRYAVRISAGPAYGSQRDALLDQLAEFARMDQATMQVIAPFFLKAINLPGSEDLAGQLKALLPPPVQQVLAMQGDQQAVAMQLNQHLEQATQMLQGKDQEIQQKSQQIQAMGQEIERLKAKNDTTLQVAQINASSAERIAQLEAQVKVLIQRMGDAADLEQIDAKAAAGIAQDHARNMGQPAGFFPA